MARFVMLTECHYHCEYGCFDHTVNWRYHDKVCLKDLNRLGIWKPEGET